MSMVKFEDIQDKIIEIRGEKVLLDSDVAEIYGVETKRVNEAVKNNMDKFPKGYMFELTKDEKKEVVEKFDHLSKLKFSPYNPKAFTEKGLYMLATILKSPRAIEATFLIIETFTKIRELSRTIKQLPEINDKQQKNNLMQRSGEIIAEILEDDLDINESETTIEINFAVLKFKHTIKRKNGWMIE